jgi:hypothetical protein
MAHRLFKFSILFVLAALSAKAQTNLMLANLDAVSNLPAQNSGSPSIVQMSEDARTQCIEGRRRICGKIIQVLPDGIVVECGYTNLLRDPLTKFWLVPGAVTASRATNLLESAEPDALCVGGVFLTNLPKSRGAKPARYDYVIIEGYPAGEYTYTTLGTIRRTVRRFSANLNRAVDFNLQAALRKPPPATPLGK